MKKAYMKRIGTIVEKLEELIEEMEQDKEAIEDKANEHDRDMTDAEQERYDELDECIYELQNAIDYISEYSA